MSQTIAERIASPDQKRILACDGGGILGLMTVEILAKIEADLRRRTGKTDLRLGDWFDFVCGTSTGAIIATCIACGMEVSQIRDFYLRSGPLMFEKAAILRRIRYAYDDEPLARMLQKEINLALKLDPQGPAAKLGDERLRCVLMIVVRNHTTDSPWPISNNPHARYNERGRADCNLDLPLWQLVRASTAAPTFFPPEVVVFAPGTAREYSFVFVDGGVTTYNNPAFLAFQMATAAPYGLDWATGTNQMLLVSVGTGTAPKARPGLEPGDLWLLDHARNIPSALMNAASAGWDMSCRIFGDCRFGGPIDREFGDGVGMEGKKTNWTAPKLFTYLRYDPDVTEAGLKALQLEHIRPDDVQLMDSVAHVDHIQKVGERFGAEHVADRHFAGFA